MGILTIIIYQYFIIMSRMGHLCYQRFLRYFPWSLSSFPRSRRPFRIFRSLIVKFMTSMISDVHSSTSSRRAGSLKACVWLILKIEDSVKNQNVNSILYAIMRGFGILRGLTLTLSQFEIRNSTTLIIQNLLLSWLFVNIFQHLTEINN